ncbi:MAG: 16S rRNA (guanine(527)-N(7))-methyltransferase RsmG [Nocardioidaceae bacterium]
MNDVSRETMEACAEALASVLFPARNKEIHRYVDLLRTVGVERGLIGPREGDRLWSRHIINCAVVAEGIPQVARVADIGSGAGLPGLVLALTRTDLQMTLVEPLLRRVRFLEEVVADLDLTTVDVVRSRAEELHGREAFDVVTARAVAPLDRLARWALPLCAPGGALLALKGGSAAEELAAAAETLDRMGAGPRSVEMFGVGLVEPATRVVRIESGAGSLGKGRT